MTYPRWYGGTGNGEVFNVRDYGALGVGTSGNDLAAINATFAAAAAFATPILGVNASGSGPTVLFPVATGYRVTGPVVVPDGVDIDMRAPIIYAGSAGQTAMVIGNGPMQMFRTYKGLWVKRETISTWTDEADIGIQIRNHYWSDISTREIKNFTIGMRLLGNRQPPGTTIADARAIVYNLFNLGLFYNNKIGLDITNDAGGWSNENLFIGGSWTNDGTLYTSIDRVGVRFGSLNASAYHNNANTFLKPSFEIKGGGLVAEGVCVLAEYGSFNTFMNSRHESPDAVALRTLNGSTGNIFEAQFSLGGVDTPTYEDLGTRPGSIVRLGTNRLPDASLRTVYAVADLHKRACYYNGDATQVNVPGLTVATSATTVDDARAQAGAAPNVLVIDPDYLQIPNTRMVGFYVSTRTNKRFTVTVDAEPTRGGRIKVRAFDAANAIITTAGTVKSSLQDLTYAAQFGGAFTTGTDANGARDIIVGSGVDHIFVGIAGGTNPAQLRAIRLTTPDLGGTASAWIPQLDNGENYALTPPTVGTWPVGRRLWNAAPTVGAVGWVCTVAGTPGTWVVMG